MKIIALFFLILINFQAYAKASFIHVIKSERRLFIMDENQQVIRTFKVMLGMNPVGKKVQEGDNKTPEGQYILDYANRNSKYHLAFHISYPSSEDTKYAKSLGVKPGGAIMLHGFPNQLKEIEVFLKLNNLFGLDENYVRERLHDFDWTNGCIAVSDEEIREIDQLIKLPIKIIIDP